MIIMRKCKTALLFLIVAFQVTSAVSQETFPVNGVADKRNGTYAFINASIVKDAQITLSNATMVVKDGKIVAVGNSVSIPADATVIDCKGKYIYPSFIDIYSIIYYNILWESKPSYDAIQNEVSHYSTCCILSGNCFNPLSKIISSYQNPGMSTTRFVRNFTNEIDSPLLEWCLYFNMS